ncbi:hypothetical protein MMC07_006424, partial [Pseudocyphellaria aurata]|nr:hypothetical protein [Pseudocyphellaria aurata]
MGPARTPRRTKGQNEHWENIGVRGRKTGVTLKPGVRDENGLETIDGIFSSPEKSPAKTNGVNEISAISEGESMDIGQGTSLDPVEVIGRARNGKNFLPPRSRSPIKTHIGSSPRRSLGPVSSPSRAWNGATPTRPMSHPPESSHLFLSRGELTPSIENSDKKSRKSDMKNMKKLQVNGKGKKRVFDLSIASESEEERNSSVINGANETNGVGFDESVGLNENVEDINGVEEVNGDDTINVGGFNEDVNGDENSPQEEPSGIAAAADQEAEKAAPEKRKNSKKALSGRDRNAKMKPPPRPTAKPSLTKPRGRKPASKPSVASQSGVRKNTPGDDNGALLLKSGRRSIKPLAFWRLERVVYGDGCVEGNNITLPSIKEVIRTDEIEVPRPKRYNYKRSKPKQPIKDEEDEEDERAPWENETGIVRAQVMQWDPAIGKYDEDNTEETDIAYAAEAIEMRDISGAEFRFAKTLTLPFFGSGMVELPPGGAKRVKNSRKMQMVFFVFYGRVIVDVGTPTTNFSIGKGGMWQVPR